MAWQEIERGSTARQVDPVSFGISSRWGAQISIRETVIVKLGWARAQALRLYVDMDGGKVKLVAEGAGQYRAGRLHKGGVLARLGVLDGFRTDKVRTMAARFAVEDGSLVVDIPAQLRAGHRPAAVPLAAAPKTPPEQAIMAKPVAQSARAANSEARVGPVARALTREEMAAKIDVSNRFFNDPKTTMGSGTRR